MFKTSWRIKIAIVFSSRQVPDHNFSEKRFQAFRSGLSAGTLTCQFFDHTKYNETPIRKNKITQTNPIKEPGGVNEGLFNFAYQFPIAGVVKIDPKTPAIWQIIMLIINLEIFFIFFLALRAILLSLYAYFRPSTNSGQAKIQPV